MNANILLESLIKTWSRDDNIRFSNTKSFSWSDGLIKYPDYYDSYNMESYHGVTRWRWWRWNGFHEAMHARYTPVNAMDIVSKIAKQNNMNTSFYRLLVNIYEDKRINDLSVDYYEGMKPELKFAKKATYSTTRYDKTPVKNRLMNVVYSVFHNVVCDKPPYQGPKLETFNDVLDAAKDRYDSIDVPIDSNRIEQLFTENKNYLMGKIYNLRFSKAPEKILDEYNEIINEHNKIEIPGKIGRIDKLTYGVPEVRQSNVNDIVSNTDSIIDELVRKMQYIQRGLREYRSEHHGEFIVEDYINGEDCYYIDSEPTRPELDETMILMDFSASITSNELQYARSYYVIFQALNRMNIDVTSLVMAPPSLYRLSDDKYGFTEDLASIVSGGGTPLSYAIEMCIGLKKRVSKLIIITDGFPENPERCKDMINQARINGLYVNILGINTDRKADLFTLIGDDISRIKFSDSLESLPEDVFSLLI